MLYMYIEDETYVILLNWVFDWYIVSYLQSHW